MNFKRFVIVALTLCLALGLCACGGESTTAPDSKGTTAAAGNEGTTAATNAATQPGGTQTEPTQPAAQDAYKVTVLDYDGNPVAGARVQLCDDNGCQAPKATDEQGVATFTCAKSEYKAQVVSGIPEGCMADEYYYFTGDSMELTIRLKTVVYNYVIKVVDEGNNPVANVGLQLQKTEPLDGATDEEGKLEATTRETVSKVILTQLPEGYTTDIMEYTLDEGVVELTITLKTVA